ncbi:Alpha/beta hydrolase fold protein [Bosea sp. LC85]|uniref:alpha/beta fold hydrolase n=1 Tax=Bosea sp. LC85 TaxID=1502851 RepID=UPI0004E3D261|nr:alpha/beta hydrolase [Bosea sp. LC85]KFC67589.1 Alpha/beta hydrolase fold protein [Bosea sp. LC85]
MQKFSSDGINLAFIDLAPTNDAPRGESIILVHGFASSHMVNWVNTQWTKTLTHVGYRVVALDNRGHGQSDKPHEPEAYSSHIMAEDVRRLMDHLEIARADVMGYSMGARISAHLALAHPQRLRSLLLGGLGIHLVEGVGLPLGIADAMEAPSLDVLSDSMQRMFRAFADANKSDLKALAACIRGSRQTLTPDEVGRIVMPTLISVGTKDDVAGSGQELAALIPNAEAFGIEGRDHNLAVGDKTHKQAVLDFLRWL